MLKFFKSFLQKEEKEEPIEVRLYIEDLHSWVQKKVETLEVKFREKLVRAEQTIANRSKVVKEKVELLGNARLQNTNIQPKALQFMKGNRESYVKLVTLLLRDSLPENLINKSVGDVQENIADFKKQVDAFSKSAWRNYQVLQQFFSHETNAVVKSIKDLENSVQELQDFINSSGVGSTESVRKELDNLKEKKKVKERLQNQLEQEQKLLMDTHKEREERKKELAAFLKTREFFEHESKRKKKEELEDQLKKHRNSLTQTFSSLDKALKKMSKIAFENEALIIEYVYRPERALISDENFKIMDILDRLEKSIDAGALMLEEKKKQKSLESIRKLSKGYFEDYVSRHKNLNQNIEQLRSEMRNSNVIIKHQSLVNEVAESDVKLGKQQRIAKQVEEQLSKIDTDQLIKELQEHINTAFDANITISKEEKQQQEQTT